MMLRKTVKFCLSYYSSNKIRKGYNKLYTKIISNNPILSKKLFNERNWVEKWSQIDSRVSINSYRIFSHYIGENLNIVPLETCATCIEPILSPREYYSFYNDKNTFNILFPLDYMPATIIRCMNGCYYDAHYKRIKNGKEICELEESLKRYSKVIIKPTVGGESGKDVKVFTKRESCWKNKNDEILSIDYLNDFYGKNFIIQEYLIQHSVLSELNSSSVNTIRIMTYRSVVNNEIIVPNSILRIGSSGSEVDNAHSGGMFCGISSDGVLGKYVCDYLGNRRNVFNNIDYNKNNIVIPNFPLIVDFAKEIASKVLHHRLLALDIMLNSDGIPKLIEINVGGFSAWLFQFTTGTVFGNYTDEVINYCISKKCK